MPAGPVAAFQEIAMRVVSAFLGSRSGTTAVEYAFIAAGISLAILVGVGLTGGAVQNKFNLVLDKMTGG
jgi:Flp pilus assembly pilin Flp